MEPTITELEKETNGEKGGKKQHKPLIILNVRTTLKSKVCIGSTSIRKASNSPQLPTS